MPNRWHPALNELISLLAGLYSDKGKARLAVWKAGLNPDDIEWEGVPPVVWMRIVEEAYLRRDSVPELIRIAKEDFPNKSQALDVIEQRLQQPAIAQPPSNAPRLSEGEWKASPVSMGCLEKVIGGQPTFLPISFLQVGLERSRSIARVNSPRGVGTGFLIHGNLLITNNHVIGSEADAKQSVIWFNYQRTPAGVEEPIAEFDLDPGAAFATSPAVGGNDWTAVSVESNALDDVNSQWGMFGTGRPDRQGGGLRQHHPAPRGPAEAGRLVPQRCRVCR